jgi:hypothetical protein
MEATAHTISRKQMADMKMNLTFEDKCSYVQEHP